MVKEIFDAFRAEGMAVSAYFSKPDWHSDAYWHRAFGTAPTRNVNYDVKEHPELWEEFVQYTHSQLKELLLHLAELKKRLDAIHWEVGEEIPIEKSIRIGKASKSLWETICHLTEVI